MHKTYDFWTASNIMWKSSQEDSERLSIKQVKVLTSELNQTSQKDKN